MNKQVGDRNERIIILDINIDEIRYVLVNIYNANTEVQEVQILSERTHKKHKFFGIKSYSFSW